MFENFLDPAILFFCLGLTAGLLKSDLRIPEQLYETLTIYILLSIGLKGGMKLSDSGLETALGAIVGSMILGASIPLLAYPALRKLGKFSRPDSAALSGHFGAVSSVTFAVALDYLLSRNVFFEDYVPALYVTLEVPAILVAIGIARFKTEKKNLPLRRLMREVLLSKSVFLLLGGLLIGYLGAGHKMDAIKTVFFDPFKGVLAIFLLEMGIVTSRRIKEVKSYGFFLAGFGIIFPILMAFLGCWIGRMAGMSMGGSFVLATLAASASYITAPVTMRMAIPEANPSLYLTTSLGIVFPFNILLGIPIYYHISNWVHAI